MFKINPSYANSISQKIHFELVNLLYKQIKFALCGEAFAGIILCSALWNTINHRTLLTWYIISFVTCILLRMVLVYCYNRVNPTYSKIYFWQWLFTVGALFSGVSWGIAGSLLMPLHDTLHQSFVTLLLIGVAAAANPFYAPIRTIYTIFLLPAFLPFSIWLFLQGDIYILLGIGGIVFIILMLATASYSFRLIYTALKLRFENSELVETLSLAKTQQEQINENLRSEILERQHVEARLAAQYSSIKALAESDTINEVFPKILEASCINLGWDLGEFWLINPSNNSITCTALWHTDNAIIKRIAMLRNNHTLASNDGLPRIISAREKPIWITNLEKRTDFNYTEFSKNYLSSLHIKTACGIPIFCSNQLYGMLIFYTDKVRQKDQEIIKLFTALASQIELFLIRKLAEEQLRLFNQNLEKTIAERTSELEKSLSLLKATFESTTDGILVVNNQGKIEQYNQKFIEIWHIPTTILAKQDDSQAISYVVNQLEKPQEFVQKIKELYQNPDIESFDELTLRDGRILERRSQPQRIGSKVVGRVWIFRDITAKKHLEKQLIYQATHDTLTNLPNRLVVLERIQLAIAHAKRANMLVAVLFLDLDGFKLINDKLGHDVGDLFLEAIAKRLKACVRETDTIARLGGDEFIVLFNLSFPEQVIPLTQKILKEISIPFTIKQNEVRGGVSIGISFYPKDGQEPQTLLKHADMAMYLAKEKGGNCFEYYVPALDSQSRQRSKIENNLSLALKNNEFFLVYQPIVNLATGNIVGMEALLRWRHPELGLVHPDSFIPIAEKSGLIIPINEWVIHTACTQNMLWQQSGLTPIYTAINIPDSQLVAKEISIRISDILTTTGLSAQLLQLEINEKMMMHNGQAIINNLIKLKELGISFVVDDFGIGYSNLGYINHFPISKLKIDRSFVKNIQDKANVNLAKMIISIARTLNLTVLAEGVETKEQLAFLKAHQCDEMQGYLFSPPIDVNTATNLLKTECNLYDK